MTARTKYMGDRVISTAHIESTHIEERGDKFLVIIDMVSGARQPSKKFDTKEAATQFMKTLWI